MKKLQFKDNSKDLKSGYDEKSPISGKFSVMVEETPDHGNFRLCMDTGYHTYDDCILENKDLIQQLESHFPPYYVDYKYIDNQERVWYPMLIANVYGMLHAYILPNEDKLGWAISDIELVDNLEDLNKYQIIKLPFNNELAICRISAEPIYKFDSIDKFEKAYDKFFKYINKKIERDILMEKRHKKTDEEE